MNARFNPQAEDLQRLQAGPIGPHLQSFAALVSQQGYCNVNGWLKIRLVAKLSRWLHQRRIPLNELNEARIAAFFNARWKRLARHSGDQITMTLLLRHLRQAKVVAPPPLTNGSDLELMILEYQGFLLSERSLMPSTTGKYLEAARHFLFRRFPDGKLYLKKLQARDVTDFVLHDTSLRGRRSAQLMATVLRSFLSFLLQKGRIATNLAAVVPSIPHQRLTGVPRYLETREVEMVLRSCDRRRKIGKRDYAIFLLLARLGLRANEVVQLTLDDIDWRAGELLIRGKGARVDRLPLLQDVGQALADYLKNARPVCSSRRLFIQCRAPLEGFAGPGCVSNLVRWALLRLNLCPRNRGAHVLRHSLATGMLRNGASLAQIGQVLRHQLPQTTEIYAKVDFNALRALALPWTGGAL
ncbi:MAG TPA: tyrosine-type recombinase/integrase [Verrucomicrobiae bacterium]|nr:tyrosine-type recombinase/integrase [Verrucomicrobiae bacterium]